MILVVKFHLFQNKLTPFFSQTPPAFFKSPVHANPNVPISKSL